MSQNQSSSKKSPSLALQIFIASVLAIIVGFLLQNNVDFANKFINPFGTIFLNLIKFIVCPIVLFSIMSGVISLGDIRKVGSIGGITISYYLVTTAFATIIGLCTALIFKSSFPILETSNLTFAQSKPSSFMDVIVNIFPSNFLYPISNVVMLQIIFMALLMGFAIISLGKKARHVTIGIDTWTEIFIKCMSMILKLSPIGVFCLLCPVIAQNGPKVIVSLGTVLLAAYIGYFLHALFVYSSTVSLFGKISPAHFFKEMLPAIIFAFSSASSVGTLPINMKCAEKLNSSKEVTSFVLPLGATINMDGTAIYQGVCSIFIASCYGIDLDLSQMLTIVATATLASIGTAGVPGAGMIMLAMVLTSVGLPVDGIALVAGIDRIFDMGRTTVNIVGDASCAVVVSNILRKKDQSGAEKGA